jgi:hypothetical protein
MYLQGYADVLRRAREFTYKQISNWCLPMHDRSDQNRAETLLVPAGRIAFLTFALLMTGCAVLEKVPGQSARKDTPQTSAGAAATVASSSATQGATPPVAVVAPGSSVAPVSAPSSSSQPALKAAAPVVAPPTKVLMPGTPAGQPAKSVPSVVAKPTASPPLDMKSLEARLKETQAIGVFTKLALKNQVDDLLDQFRAFYQGQLKTTLAELRRPYEMLLQKVLALLQDSDPPLAGAIVASREAIWGILADPAKFATI